jgi:hypothetical protein
MVDLSYILSMKLDDILNVRDASLVIMHVLQPKYIHLLRVNLLLIEWEISL